MFQNRREAGLVLGEKLHEWSRSHPVVVGMPRGGVVVAAEVARMLDAPLDVIGVRKVGVPLDEELAVAAVGEGGIVVVNHDIADAFHIVPEQLEELAQVKIAELEQLLARLRRGRPALDLRGRTVIAVDDGLATGATARAAVQSLRTRKEAAKVVLAVPVAATQTEQQLASEVDDLVKVVSSSNLGAIGWWYEDFAPVREEEVVQLLDEAARRIGQE
ncbi:MAG: phosphoribosyltransferase [Actinobacteria bacterium]|jgi:putative phosphoribosyl transferase|nr:phosphoribosyltransferase [Actinomycetota bacterium]